jgi:lipoprotein-anchoring transpeptidase ErfK/SrfK
VEMNLPKIIMTGAVLTFAVILVVGLLKSSKEEKETSYVLPEETVALTIQELESSPSEISPSESSSNDISLSSTPSETVNMPLPTSTLVEQLFTVNGPKLPIVKTITYKRKVPWLKGRAAWLVDYSHHFDTSRYFISRSLSRKKDYFYESYSDGDRFNIYDPEKNFYFYLLVDVSRSKLWLHYVDTDSNERILLKEYNVGLGRPDPSSPSGILTPLGKYSIGKRVAIYKPGVMGYFNHKKVEMIRIFGTRWIPFEGELGNNSAPAKGFGLHGTPWHPNEQALSKLADGEEGIGGFESDGCIRLKTEDIEEIFAVIVDRKAVIEVVNNYFTAKLPGKESLLR